MWEASGIEILLFAEQQCDAYDLGDIKKGVSFSGDQKVQHLLEKKNCYIRIKRKHPQVSVCY